MLRIPEFRSPTGGLAAGAAEISGITKRREGQSVKNVKNIILGGACSGCTAMMVKYFKPKFQNWRHGTRKPQERIKFSYFILRRLLLDKDRVQF